VSAPSYKVISLPDPLHEFLTELMTRVVREGLIAPDELGYAAALWDRIRNAQVIVPPAEPIAHVPTEEAP